MGASTAFILSYASQNSRFCNVHHHPTHKYSDPSAHGAQAQRDLLCTPTTTMKLKSLPPGVPFVARYLLVLATPPFAVYLASRVLHSYGVALPNWSWILLAIFSGPVYQTIRIQLKYRSFRRGAARLGAVLPGEMAGTWIGNWDILDGILKAFIHGYPCKCIDCVSLVGGFKTSCSFSGHVRFWVWRVRSYHAVQSFLGFAI